MSETLDTAQAEAPVGDDLRSVLSAAWDEHETVETEDTGRPRDERGRFASSREVEDAPDTETPDQPEAKADEPATPAIEPPQSWSADERAHWASLSPAAQETILRRERDMDKVLSERAAEQRELNPLREVLAPYQADHAMRGLSSVDAVKQLLAAEEWLRKDPDRAFPELMRQYGYDPRRLGLNVPPQAQQAPTQQFNDPRVDRLIADMQARQQQDTLAQIKAFADDPAHPHFDDVKQDMGRLIAANPDMSMKRAYEIAVAANSDVQAKIRAAADKAAREKAAKEAAEKAEAAKRAAVSVRDRGASGGSPAPARHLSVRENLLAAWEGV